MGDLQGDCRFGGRTQGRPDHGWLVRAIEARAVPPRESAPSSDTGAISIARGLPRGWQAHLLRAQRGTTPSEAHEPPEPRRPCRQGGDLVWAPAIEDARRPSTTRGFDFAFIDADKVGYPGYYRGSGLRLLRPQRPA